MHIKSFSPLFLVFKFALVSQDWRRESLRGSHRWCWRIMIWKRAFVMERPWNNMSVWPLWFVPTASETVCSWLFSNIDSTFWGLEIFWWQKTAVTYLRQETVHHFSKRSLFPFNWLAKIPKHFHMILFIGCSISLYVLDWTIVWYKLIWLYYTPYHQFDTDWNYSNWWNLFRRRVDRHRKNMESFVTSKDF